MIIKNFKFLSVSLILLLGAISTLSALPFFRFGVWKDAEPTVVATFALGGFVWVWNSVVLVGNKESAFPKTIIISIFFALWSFLVSFAAPYPLLSLLGSPQLAEGGIYVPSLDVRHFDAFTTFGVVSYA